MNLKEGLQTLLKEGESMPTGFDVVGDIAILEIPQELAYKEKKIGQLLLSIFPNIKVVVKKFGIHGGKFRLQKYRILAGARRKTTIHKESGILLKLHIEKTYFSVRSGTERLRVAALVKEGERVLVMFAGVAPFPLVIARHSKAGRVVGVELNNEAHKFGLENVRINKLEKRVELLGGDVRKILPGMHEKFDRIIMPLPKDAELFLADALKVARKGTMIHIYYFGREDEIPAIGERIVATAKQAGRVMQVSGVVRAGNFAPRVYRLCFDCEVLD